MLGECLTTQMKKGMKEGTKYMKEQNKIIFEPRGSHEDPCHLLSNASSCLNSLLHCLQAYTIRILITSI